MRLEFAGQIFEKLSNIKFHVRLEFAGQIFEKLSNIKFHVRLEFAGQIFEKLSNMKFHENPFPVSRAVPCGRTDRHDEASSHLSQFCHRA